MVLGGATQKIQTIIELAEDLYERVTELREQVIDTKETVEDSNDRIRSIERELDEQRAVIEAIAQDHGVDLTSVRESISAEEEDSEKAVTSDDP